MAGPYKPPFRAEPHQSYDEEMLDQRPVDMAAPGDRFKAGTPPAVAAPLQLGMALVDGIASAPYQFAKQGMDLLYGKHGDVTRPDTFDARGAAEASINTIGNFAAPIAVAGVNPAALQGLGARTKPAAAVAAASRKGGLDFGSAMSHTFGKGDPDNPDGKTFYVAPIVNEAGETVSGMSFHKMTQEEAMRKAQGAAYALRMAGHVKEAEALMRTAKRRITGDVAYVDNVNFSPDLQVDGVSVSPWDAGPAAVRKARQKILDATGATTVMATRATGAGTRGRLAIFNDQRPAAPFTVMATENVNGPPLPSASAPKETRMSGTFLNDPPGKPQRSFNDDYQRSPRQDSQGRLEETIDGDRLNAPFVAGRVRRDEPESRILPEQSVQIAEAILGTGPRAAPRSVLGRNLGTYDSRGIRYRDDLEGPARDRVINHELGHAIDEISGQIKSDGIKSELSRLYSGGVSGNFDRTRNLTLPEHVGYRKAESEREMMAEAIRIYMTDPNFLKTVAPKTAKRIREAVNTNPRISGVLQFNSMPHDGAFGGVIAASGSSQQPFLPTGDYDDE